MKELREKVKELLRDKKVDIVIGYTEEQDRVISAFIQTEQDADKLIFDNRCVYNLSNYLKWHKDKKVALTLKGCDAKSINVLIQEFQIKRQNVFIIGLECYGVIDEKKKDNPANIKCSYCNVNVPDIYDVLMKAKEPRIQNISQNEPFKDIEELQNLTTEQKWRWWQEQFSKCIKCYACREICPMCYCRECIVECNIPQWILPSTSLKGNFEWNIVRAFHLAGRCIDCGECQRACPVGIPLMKLNRKLAKEVKELFDYVAGQKSDVKPVIDDFYPEKDSKNIEPIIK